MVVSGTFTVVPGAASPRPDSPTRVEKPHRNAARDKRTNEELRRDGWKPLVIWECQLCRRRSSGSEEDRRLPDVGGRNKIGRAIFAT